MEKKHYNAIRKHQADTRLLLRGLVTVYLLYLAWKVPSLADTDPTFPPMLGLAAGILFAAVTLVFGVYAWRRYRIDCHAAELTPEEEIQRQLQEREEAS